MSFICNRCGKERKEIIIRKIFKQRIYAPFNKDVSIIIPNAKVHRCNKCKEDLLDKTTVKQFKKEWLRLEKLNLQHWLNGLPISDFISKDEALGFLREIFDEREANKILRNSIITKFSLLKGRDRYYYSHMFIVKLEHFRKFYIRPISNKSDYQLAMNSFNKKGSISNGTET